MVMHRPDRKTIPLAAAACLSLVFQGACSRVPGPSQDISETSMELTETSELQTAEPEEVEDTQSAESEEYVPPFSEANEIFSYGDQDYFVPFSDPERSFCYIDEGICVPVMTQVGGTCWAYSSVVTMQLQNLIDGGGFVQIDPLEIVDIVYDPDLTGDDEEGLHLAQQSDDYRYGLGGSYASVAMTMAYTPVNGYYVTDSDILVSQAQLDNEYEEGEGPGVADIGTIQEYLRNSGPLCVGVLAEMNPQDYHMVHGYMTLSYSDEMTDHLVTIVGYDDDFPASAFIHRPARDGAWLVQNSWGSYSGNSGYCWISYDCYIEYPGSLTISNGYTDAFTYNHDVSEQVSTGEITSVASVYDHEGTLAAVGTETFDAGTTVTVEVRDGQFGEILSEKTVTFDWPGYHTIELDEEISVEEFTVVIRSDGQVGFEIWSYGDDIWVLGEEYGATEGCTVISYAGEGQSFIETSEGWTDITDESLYGGPDLEKPLADPFIVLLFR